MLAVRARFATNWTAKVAQPRPKGQGGAGEEEDGQELEETLLFAHPTSFCLL